MNTIKLSENLDNCCGCGACAYACPRNAISMVENALGVIYPQIDEQLCVHCGKCLQVCSYQSKPTKNVPINAFAAAGKDQELISQSASGGIFASLSRAFLQDGGLVAGAVMDFRDNRAEVYHILTDNLRDIERLQGSKYVQSNAFKCFSDIQEALKTGKMVLFSGTPCQVAALKQLTGNPENLFTMDLVCHGVPTRKMLNDYLKCVASRFGGTLEALCFRDKLAGKDFTARFEMRRGNKKRNYYLRSGQSSFYSMFLKGSIYRESCYHCPYADSARVSDVTIGDYWGIMDYHAREIESGSMSKQKHWSCVLVNTQKGQRFLQQYEQSLDLFATKLEWVCARNVQLREPSKKTQDTERILNTYENCGYSKIEKQFLRDAGGILRYYWHIWKFQRKIRQSKGH